jgi:creatinine amidohydrolase
MEVRMEEVFIERLTWPDVEARIAAGSRRAVICAASSEQHGPQLPEATDALIGAAVAERLARLLGDALVAPVIRPGCSEHHMGFAGSLTISPALLMDILDAYVDGLRRHGFDGFVVFSSHGGNFSVLEEWNRTRPKPGAVVISDLMGFTGAMLGVARAHGRDDGGLVHAEYCETSIMLAIHPDLVHTDRSEPGFSGELLPERLFAEGMRGISANGVLGNPVGAEAAVGEELLDAVGRWLATQVRASTG